MDRRDFLRAVARAGAGTTLAPLSGLTRTESTGTLCGLPGDPRHRKLVIVQFGGGTRSSETVDDPRHRHVPRLWTEMVPRGALLTNMRVEGQVVHPNSTGSMVTGHWEWADLDWSRPPAHPSLFEVVRRARGTPDTSAWAFVYASILARIGESRADGYGIDFAANVIEPPTIPRSTAEEIDRGLRLAAATGSIEAQLGAAAVGTRLCRTTSRIARHGLRSDAARRFLEQEYADWRDGEGSSSHDAFLTARAIACMRRFAPEVLMVAFGEIDCAHYGSWSRYVEAIRRTDELTWLLWRTVETLPEYRGRTLLLVLPDHGRELDRPGRWGFVHHSDFYTDQGADEGCRRVWMLALGPGVVPGLRVATPVPITTVAATGLEFLGLCAPAGAERSVLGRLQLRRPELRAGLRSLESPARSGSLFESR